MLLNGKELSLKMKESLIEKVEKLEKKPGLVVIQVGDDKASSIYVNSKGKLAREIGYNFEHIKLPITITEEEMIEIIEKINKELGTTIIMATHDKDIVNRMKKRVLVINHGVLVGDYAKGSYKTNESV